MKINERFSIIKDRYNCILIETGEYIHPETGEISHPESRSYYPDLECCCRAMLKRDISAAIMMCGGVV